MVVCVVKGGKIDMNVITDPITLSEDCDDV